MKRLGWAQRVLWVAVTVFVAMTLVACSSGSGGKSERRRDCESAGNSPSTCRSWIGI